LTGIKLVYFLPVVLQNQFMKNLLLAFAAAILFIACSRTSYPGSEPYPVPPGSPVPGDPRYPDQSRIPDERKYPYPSGDNTNVYEGQRDGVVTIIKTGKDNYEKLPPGQAKKKYGSKSAKVYAPGQQKKNGQNNSRIATVISVPDRYASRATSGQLYYNYRGNTYWKQNDGYFYLANKNVYKENDDKKYKKKVRRIKEMTMIKQKV